MKAISSWKSKLKDDSGNVLVVAAFSMTALMGFLALATDVGMLYRGRRDVQIVADSAAIAASLNYLHTASVSSAQTAGQTAATRNGVTNGTNGAAVVISIPPVDGPNAGNTAFAEAQVSLPQNTLFLSMFGFKTMTVTARGVAGTPTYGNVCIWLMANSGTAMSLQGSYDIEATGCGAYVNSTSSSALSVTGNGGIMNTEFLDVVGGSTSIHATSPTSPTLYTAPRKSPWGNLTGPTESNSGCTTIDSSTTTITGDQTASAPGLGNAICYQKAVTLSGATFGPGVYMFENGVSISGTVTVNGGVLDIYGGTLNQPSNTILNITAPTSGTYDGIAIMQPANNTNALQVQFGSNNQTLDGYIYAPGAQVSLQDNGGGIVATGIVASSMALGPSTIRIPSYDKAHPHTTLNRVVTLVE